MHQPCFERCTATQCYTCPSTKPYVLLTRIIAKLSAFPISRSVSFQPPFFGYTKTCSWQGAARTLPEAAERCNSRRWPLFKLCCSRPTFISRKPKDKKAVWPSLTQQLLCARNRCMSQARHNGLHMQWAGALRDLLGQFSGLAVFIDD